jgi:hypothetical protein
MSLLTDIAPTTRTNPCGVATMSCGSTGPKWELEKPTILSERRASSVPAENAASSTNVCTFSKPIPLNLLMKASGNVT